MSKGLLHHIEIYVSNLKRSIDFWSWFLEELGYTPYQVWESGQSADSRQQVDEITEKLKDTGVNILYPNAHPFAGGNEHYAVYFEDPDRIKVEFVAP
ncbi:VOC family protein [Bacillus sp. V2I10]|uniref:VOC family protein n=1 Tax=Bacillus sp. V2I10 TaxID=3042276 RepID=UPI0027863342|nr:VOC family protein [Bacillus sp. V2I10]MDQ0859752.1 catechol 2,3-dioxygenase-like lactoylglutathione lyase family enzyme [Bacillus sp. V2I10]